MVHKFVVPALSIFEVRGTVFNLKRSKYESPVAAVAKEHGCGNTSWRETLSFSQKVADTSVPPVKRGSLDKWSNGRERVCMQTGSELEAEKCCTIAEHTASSAKAGWQLVWFRYVLGFQIAFGPRDHPIAFAFGFRTSWLARAKVADQALPIMHT